MSGCPRPTELLQDHVRRESSQLSQLESSFSPSGSEVGSLCHAAVSDFDEGVSDRFALDLRARNRLMSASKRENAPAANNKEPE